MIMTWNGRVSALQKNGKKVDYTYNDGILQSTHLCIMKNAPNPKTAMTFVNAAIAPEYQANLPQHIDIGPGNPAAFKTPSSTVCEPPYLHRPPYGRQFPAVRSAADETLRISSRKLRALRSSRDSRFNKKPRPGRASRIPAGASGLVE